VIVFFCDSSRVEHECLNALTETPGEPNMEIILSGREIINHIGGVMGSVGSNLDRVKPKTIKFVFVASPLSTQR
jgi:hypothetical protein